MTKSIGYLMVFNTVLIVLVHTDYNPVLDISKAREPSTSLSLGFNYKLTSGDGVTK